MFVLDAEHLSTVEYCHTSMQVGDNSVDISAISVKLCDSPQEQRFLYNSLFCSLHLSLPPLSLYLPILSLPPSLFFSLSLSLSLPFPLLLSPPTLCTRTRAFAQRVARRKPGHYLFAAAAHD